MPYYRAASLCLLLLCFSTALSARVLLQLQGLQGELRKNVRARLSTIDLDEIVPDGRFRARVENEIQTGLRALGYYQPNIAFVYRPAVGKVPPVLVAEVSAGEPVKIAGVQVTLQGGAASDARFQTLLTKQQPKVGSVLNHGDYDDFKKSLNSLALSRGYFDAEFTKNQLGVAENLYKAYWDIDFDSGQRYRFGNVTFTGSQIRHDYLQNLLPFHYGDYYTSSDLAELNRRLSATNWFKSVVVSPDFVAAKKDKILPLQAVMTPQARNAIEMGLGYSSDIGFNGKLKWKKPWINDRGQSFESGLNLSNPNQQVDFSYKIPLLKNPLEQYYLLQTGFQRQDINDTRTTGSTVNVSRFWNLSSGWQRAINLRWSYDQFTQGSVENTTMLLYPGVSINRTRQRGGLMPRWGDTQRYSIDWSNTSWGSDINFAIFQLANVWIRTLGESNRFVIRANAGWIETNDFDRVPPTLRFFAGGDRSIRGYKYQSISPRDSNGKLDGASKLLTGSFEYQYNVTGKWWGAAFVDSGEAVDDIKRSDFKTGVGVGIRWESPVGPVKLDIAAPIHDSSTQGMQIYIGLGPEL